MKRCRTCKEQKDESEFHKDHTKADGLCGQCKVCRKLERGTESYKAAQREYRASRSHKSYRKLQRAAKRAKVTLELGAKICTKCKKEKPLTEFVKDPSKLDGLCSHCKACTKEKREKTKAAKELLRQPPVEVYESKTMFTPRPSVNLTKYDVVCTVAEPNRIDVMHGPIYVPDKSQTYRPGAFDFLKYRSVGNGC